MIRIIGAMDIEFDALCEKMENPVHETVSGVDFIHGSLCGKETVLAVCGIGKVFAAICAQTMILKYNVEAIINTGVGGSLSPELNVGDIAIASGCVQHDMDTTPLGDPPGLLSGINIVNIPADKALCEKIAVATDRLGIKSLVGTIASGDKFISSADQKESISSLFGAIACEMEGAAIGHVCYVNKVPFGIIRSISDNANGDAEVDYPTFRISAAKNSINVVLELLK